MGRTVGIGIQDFEKIRERNCFYVDKTDFIKEWWESGDDVTLIARPRRFGKTLNMSMLHQFFSVEYANRGDLFEGLSIWNEEKYRKLQGTYPVIYLSFANIKENDFETTSYRIRQFLMNLYEKHSFLRECDLLSDSEKNYFERMASDMSEKDAPLALYQLSDFLYRYYNKKVIILLDEYDTPMQEAYVSGFWDELVSFIRRLFNSTFKTNPYMEKGIMTGITRVSKESVFSDLNNLEVVTTTSDKYTTSFGFTEEEVFNAMDEMGLSDKKKVKEWYDGFMFGSVSDIYNPWSIINYLDKRKFSAYWANTSSNSLVGSLLRQGNRRIKEKFETLIQGGNIKTQIDEQIVYNQLDDNEDAIWSLLLASGYLKVVKAGYDYDDGEIYGQTDYELTLTNGEVRLMFRRLVSGWFGRDKANYNDFIKAMLLDDLDAMNEYMNRVSESVFSSFDTGKKTSKSEPERFYHGFVLGLIVDLQGSYIITSNRESGFGRYDVILHPKKAQDDAIIIEFKVFNKRKEKSLEDTVASALAQIEEKQYDKILTDHGIAPERIRKYGFAFEGKKVLIG